MYLKSIENAPHQALKRKPCQDPVTITAIFSNPLMTRGRGTAARQFIKLQGVTGYREGTTRCVSGTPMNQPTDGASWSAS